MSELVKTIDILDSITEVEEKLNLIVEKNQDEISKYELVVELAKVAKAEAAKKAEEAKKGADLDTYTELLAVSRKASDELEFYSGKLKKLKAEPLISEQEYADYTNVVKSELDKINHEKRLEAQELLKELSLIVPELSLNINKGNELLKTLQHTLLKDDASMTAGDGRRVKMEHLENRYKDYSLVQIIPTIMNTAGVSHVIFKK